MTKGVSDEELNSRHGLGRQNENRNTFGHGFQLIKSAGGALRVTGAVDSYGPAATFPARQTV